MKTKTRERLVEVARQLFWEQGYANTGIAQILQVANVRSGSLYYFFPTKEDLLLAVLEHYQELLEPMVIGPLFERVHDPIERIFGLLDGYRRQLLATNYMHGCPIGNLALEITNAQPSARKLVAANFSAWRRAVEQCLADVAGRLPQELDREQLALFVLTTMEGAVMLARSYHSVEPYDAAVTQLRDYFARLLNAGTDWNLSRTRRRRSSRRRAGSK
jgi:TetR/AcrR family transcriptional regulator, transcriptional repressor for nem operon